MNTSPGQPPETASTAAAAAATNSSDPLYQIVAVFENEEKPADAVAALYSLYKRSPDVRAMLRLVDPAFIDILTTGASFSSSTSKNNNIGKEAGAGTRLVRLLTAHVLDGSDEAAEMLADMLDNDRRSTQDATMGLETMSALEASIVQTILHRVKCGRCPESGTFARLLSVVTVKQQRIATAALEDNKKLQWWIPLLISAIADALIGDSATTTTTTLPETNRVAAEASRLLRLLTFVIEQYDTTDVLSALPSLRTLTRRIIAMLSAPIPLVAAPALHAITLLVLGANSYPVAKDSPMYGLSRSLSAKLFDASHMNRTLTLVADFCLNCQEPSSSTSHSGNEAERGDVVVDDLVVLEAVSGIIGAIVRNTGAVRKRFYESTTVVQAIVHLQQLASYDHRYLTPLLSIVSAIVSLSDDSEQSLASPLLQSLLFHAAANDSSLASINDATVGDCIVKEIVDFVTLCFEDSVDMMFPMAMGCRILDLRTEHCFPPDHQQQQQQQQPMWLCTSYEGSYGWCFNSGQKQQRRISQALVSLVDTLKHVRKSNRTDDQGALWMRRIVDTVVGPHLSRHKDVVGSLRGKAPGYGLDKETAERRLVHQLTYIGCHYLIVKPVLALAADLAYGSLIIAAAPKDGPESHSSSTELQSLFDWAQTVVSPKTGEKQPTLRQEVLSLLSADGNNDDGGGDGDSLIEQHWLRSVPNAVTPDSAFSSPGSAMHGESIIDIDELRKANSKEEGWLERAGLGISMDHHLDGSRLLLLERSRLAQVLLIGYWKRLCDVELARLLVQLSKANDPATERHISFSANTVGKGISLLPPTPSLFDCMSAIVDLHKHQMSAKATAENAFHKAMQSKQAALAGAEDEIAYLSSELQSAREQHGELTRRIERHQEINGEIEQESKRLKTTVDELTAAHKQAHADGVEWKEECVATRELLDMSERSAAKTRLNLEQLSVKHGRMEREYERGQEIWATKHREMAKSNKELELALANAVARLRDVEAQADLDRSVNEELRRQNAAMAMRLSEFSKLSETLHNLSRIPN